MGLEFIATETSTGNDFTEITFDPVIDFSDYSEAYFVWSGGFSSSRDITFQFGDSGESGVLTTSTYTYVTSDNTDGTQSNEVHALEDKGRVANHPRIEAQHGCGGILRIFLTRDSSGDERLAWQSFTNGWDSWWFGGGENITIQTDLKYFRLVGGGDDMKAGSNITYYKMSKV